MGMILHDQLSDAQLYQALQQGKKEALTIIYQRYGQIVYGLSLRIVKEPLDAQDVTQEIFVSLWRNARYDPARASLGSYLTMLTRSRSLDTLRVRGSKRKFLECWGSIMVRDTTSPLLEQVASQEQTDCLREAMTQLPHKQQQVLEMNFFEGFSQTEIAQQLDAPLGTVKSWSRLGLVKLRQSLKSGSEDERLS